MNLNNTPRTEIRRNARWLSCLTRYIAIIIFSISPVFSKDNGSYCTNFPVDGMLKEVEEIAESNDKAKRKDKFGDYDVSDIAKKYIPSDCALIDVLTRLKYSDFEIDSKTFVKHSTIISKTLLFKGEKFLVFRPSYSIFLKYKDSSILEIKAIISIIIL